MSSPFVHLHCHSHFSLLDGASPIKKLVSRAKALGMNGLALTDHGNLYGALQFYEACKAAEINPVVGYEAYVAPESRFDKGGDVDGYADAEPEQRSGLLHERPLDPPHGSRGHP